MTADMPDGASMLSRLEAAQSAIAEVHGRLQSDGDGSRAALVTFAGFQTPEENLTGGAKVITGLTDDLGSVLGAVQAIDVTDIQSGDTSPLAIALGVARQLLQDTGNPSHLQGVMLLTDGIPNIDGEGRGPDGYELDELQAIYLDNLRLYGLGLEGSGVDLGTFNGDLLHYDACLMLRSDLAVRGPRAMACFIPHLDGGGGLTTGLQFHYRDDTGYTDDWANLLQHIPLPIRFAIVRQGDTLTVEYSRDDGATWTQPTGGAQGSVDIVLPETVLVGPAVASYDVATPLTASFDDFAVCPADEEVAP